MTLDYLVAVVFLLYQKSGIVLHSHESFLQVPLKLPNMNQNVFRENFVNFS
jgi:hypothetical protein